MAQHVEPMDIDSSVCDFDNKENSLHHNNVLPKTPSTEKGYEELDVNELTMKLRYSVTPSSSPMSKSYTTSLDNRTFEPDSLADNCNLTRSLNANVSKIDKLPLQTISTDQFVDGNRNPLRPLESAVPADNVTVTVTGPGENDENLSLPSSSSSMAHTPEATTPTGDHKGDGGSPIMRGLKSVLNMFRPSQSPIPTAESEIEPLKPEAISPPVINSPESPNSRPQAILASTPLAAQTTRDALSKRNSHKPRESIVFNDDLEKDLEWKDDSTVIFSHEKIPIHKLFFQQSLPMNSATKEVKQNTDDKINASVEYMDISYNNSVVLDKTVTQDQSFLSVNKEGNIATESDGEFVDCESTFAKDDTAKEAAQPQDDEQQAVNNDMQSINISNLEIQADAKVTSVQICTDVPVISTDTKAVSGNDLVDIKNSENIVLQPEESSVENAVPSEEIFKGDMSGNCNLLPKKITSLVNDSLGKQSTNIKNLDQTVNVASTVNPDFNAENVNVNTDVSVNVKADNVLDSIPSPELGVNTLSMIPLIADPRVLLFNIEPEVPTEQVKPQDENVLDSSSPADIPLPDDDEIEKASLITANNDQEDSKALENNVIEVNSQNTMSIDEGFVGKEKCIDDNVPVDKKLSLPESVHTNEELAQPYIPNLDQTQTVGSNITNIVYTETDLVPDMANLENATNIAVEQNVANVSCIHELEVNSDDIMKDISRPPSNVEGQTIPEQAGIEDLKMEEIVYGDGIQQIPPLQENVTALKDESVIAVVEDNTPIESEIINANNEIESNNVTQNLTDEIPKDPLMSETLNQHTEEAFTAVIEENQPIFGFPDGDECSDKVDNSNENLPETPLVSESTIEHIKETTTNVVDMKQLNVSECIDNIDQLLNEMTCKNHVDVTIVQEDESHAAVELTLNNTLDDKPVDLNTTHHIPQDIICNDNINVMESTIFLKETSKDKDNYTDILSVKDDTSLEPQVLIENTDDKAVFIVQEVIDQQDVSMGDGESCEINQVIENSLYNSVLENLALTERANIHDATVKTDDTIVTLPHSGDTDNQQELVIENGNTGDVKKEEITQNQHVGLDTDSAISPDDIPVKQSQLEPVGSSEAIANTLEPKDDMGFKLSSQSHGLENIPAMIEQHSVVQSEVDNTFDEEIIASKDNSPFVSVSAEDKSEDSFELISEVTTNEGIGETLQSQNPPSSPKIVSKGAYNFNFDEIEDPFATKTKIRMSPSPDEVSCNRTFEDVKTKERLEPGSEKTQVPQSNANKNRRRSQPLKRKPIAAVNKKMNSTFGSFSSGTDNKDNKKNASKQQSDKKPNCAPEVNIKQDNSNSNSPIVNSISTEKPCEKPEEMQIDDVTFSNSSENIKAESITKHASALSIEQSEYYSGVSSGSDTSKSVFNIPEIDDMNFNPFATKSKIRQSPPPGDEIPIDIKCNFETEIKIDDNKQLFSAATNDFVDTLPEIIKNESSEKPTVNIEDIDNINTTTSSKATDDRDTTVRTIHTEDEDTIEGPFLEPEDLVDDKMSDFDGKDVCAMQFTEMPVEENDENADAGELFIDAQAYEFLLNQNNENFVADSGKESLFLKFDPLFAKRVSTGGVMAALSNVQKKQSTPKKFAVPPADATFVALSPFGPVPSTSATNVTQEIDVNADESNDDLNVTVSKPMMVVTPAVNPVVTPRNKTTTPIRSNRQSLTFTSPAIAVIDRLLSMSANNSLLDQNTTVTDPTREQREADLALTQLRELLADKEINVYNLRSESKELKDRLLTLETQMHTLESIGEERLKKINDLTERLDEKTKINKNMATVVEEYERTISSLIAETEQDKKRNAEEKIQLMRERDEQANHLASMEISFNDLHSKYEKCKQIILGFKANEDTYKKSMKDFEENLTKMQKNYELLKQHATSKLNHANEELQKINRSHESEVLKLNAMIKRKELHITSLEETLSQKMKANEELTKICDELLNKV